MRRLYVLMPDVESCKGAVKELRTIGIPKHHLHVMANLMHNLEGLPQATVWQKTELIHGIAWGVGLGGVAGFTGIGLAMIFPPAGLEISEIAPFAGAIAGAVLGGTISAILSSHEHSHTLDRFRTEISRGRLLLMIDAPYRQVEEIQSLIHQYHPEANIEVTIPNQ